MNKQIATAVAFLPLALSSLQIEAASIRLFEYAFNIDGTLSNPTQGDAVPLSVNLAGLDTFSGLGTISFSLTGAGTHSFLTYFDHDFDEAINTFFNELGEPGGVPAPGQSWEIDEPGFAFGDIYDNFLNGTLDNTVGTTAKDDVAVALGWLFDLAPSQTASIVLNLSETAPSSGFYLRHSDPDSQVSIFFSSALSITGEPPTGVPDAGSSLLLLGAGIASLRGLRSLRW